MEDERAKVAFEYFGIYLDRKWQGASNPDAFRYYQGMADMLKIMPRLADQLQSLAEDQIKRAQAQHPRVGDRVVEPGSETPDLGMEYFRNGGKK